MSSPARCRSARAGALALATLALVPATAYACACCADPGTWFQTVERTGPLERGELRRIRVGPVARLAVGAAGIDAVKGIVDPADRYSLSRSTVSGRWLLRFVKAGRTGTLAFTVPRTTVVFGVDPRDGRRAAAGGPVLYKEWRLTGPVRTSGAFAPSGRGGARFRLLLQGRGNVCLDAAHFTHWRLEVSGPNARYAFFGSLRRPAPA